MCIAFGWQRQMHAMGIELNPVQQMFHDNIHFFLLISYYILCIVYTLEIVMIGLIMITIRSKAKAEYYP